MMSSAFEDCVVDFDLSSFQPSSNNAVVCMDKACKAIIKTKHKIITTDKFINKYQHLSQSYKELEKSFITSKEEYKQACIEGMEFREKCLALEKEIKNLQSTNKELELNCVAAYNQHDGMQSHAKQLEQLVKENETLIESLKAEYQIEKANSKGFEITNSKLQKENEHLIKNISFMRDIIFGKRKLTKELKSLFLLTCVKKSDHDDFDSGEIRCDGVNTLDDLLSLRSPDLALHHDKLGLTSPIENGRENKNTSGSELRSFEINEGNTYTRDDNDQDDDDGRGSSLAFSDKCFNSPEYFTNDSPLTADVLRRKDKVTVNASTSPLPIKDFIDVATSPIMFKNLNILDGIEKNVCNELKPNARDTYNNWTENMIDRVHSPIFATHDLEISTSTIDDSMNDATTGPLKQDVRMSNCNTQQADQNAYEKDLMEINISSFIEDENSNDCEVQMILKSMRNEILITPIPTTPAKSRNLEASTNIDQTYLLNIIAKLLIDVEMLKDHTKMQQLVLAQTITPNEVFDAVNNNAMTEMCMKLRKESMLRAGSSPQSPRNAATPSPACRYQPVVTPPSLSDATLLSPPRPSDATPLSPPRPSDATPLLPPRPSDATPLSRPRPSDATPLSPPRPSDATPLSPPRPSDATALSPQRPRDATPLSPPRPSDATPFSPPRPSDATPLSPPRPSDATPLSPQRPRDATPLSPPRPSDATPLSPPRPSDATPLSPPRPSDATPLSPPRPNDAAPPSPPNPSDAAPPSPPSRSDAAPLSPPRPSDAELLSPPSPCDAELLAPLRPGDAAPTSPPSRSDDVSLSPPSRRDAAPLSPSSSSDAALLSVPRPSDAEPVSPPSPSDAAPPSPSPSLLTPERSDVDNYNTYHETEDISLRAKERRQIEIPISNHGLVADRASSDFEVYESKIIIELPPDTLESDTNTLHEMLKRQDSKQQNIHEAVQNKKTPKKKNNTKLEKLRKRLLPKSKIKNVDVPAKRRKRIQPKRLNTNGDRILVSQISHNAAYEKACKVMSELKSKEKLKKKDDFVIVVLPKLALSPRKGTQKTCSELLRTDLFNSNKNLQEPCIQKQNQVIAQNCLSKGNSAKFPVKLNKPSKSKFEISNATQIYKEVGEKNKTKPALAPALENSQLLQNNSGLPARKIIRTRSQSKSHDVCMSQKREGRCDPGLPPLSPKMYGKNRRKSKVEDSLILNNTIVGGLITSNIEPEKSNGNSETKRMANRNTLKRQSVDVYDYPSKRMLRSSSARNDSTEPRLKRVIENNEEMISRTTKEMVTYGDIDMFQDTEKPTNELVVPSWAKKFTKKFGILCNVLDRYGRNSSKIAGTKLPDNDINNAYKQIENCIAEIQKLHNKDCKVAMDKLVNNLQGFKPKQIIAGIIRFLKEPDRKLELFNKSSAIMTPPLTKYEQILVYIVIRLKVHWPDLIENILHKIEYSLFMLNSSPDFNVIETLAHFYAVICRYESNRSRLRMFTVNAMYCLGFKAIPLIKQCIEVDMKILPLAHLGQAKSPLVMCLVYLLHFYKCEDKYNRVQEIRNILHRKYFYEVSEWNEPLILEMFRSSIVELSDLFTERRLLRVAFIILSKRNGARWCQNNIIKNMLLPIIEQPQVPDRIKPFCVSLLGALLKPYPIEMRVDCEIVMNQLSAILSRKPSDKMVEAIFTSFINLSRHNQNRVIKALLFWKPARISPELENLLKIYVKERPLKSWRTIISKLSNQQT